MTKELKRVFCKDCEAWDGGTCRRHSPAPERDPISGRAYWPHTGMDDWCLDAIPRKEK